MMHNLSVFNKENNDFLTAISDLMSGLMIVFVLIAVAYMYTISQAPNIQAFLKKEQRIQEKIQQIKHAQQKLQGITVQYHNAQTVLKEIIAAYRKTQLDLYRQLRQEFHHDLAQWGANIDQETLSIQFNEPETLFKAGQSDLSPKFKMMLASFFPKYIKILFSDYINNISEIRIEGHTSSEWNIQHPTTADESYFNNMALSQERTRSVLSYCYQLIDDPDYKKMMQKYITANGLSSSKLKYTPNGLEDKEKSRRVEFRIKTNFEDKSIKILQNLHTIEQEMQDLKNAIEEIRS